MAQASGGRKSRHYVDTKGVKVSEGEFVKAGTILTREGNRWKAGLNVGDSGTLFALSSGRIYFKRRKGKRLKRQTFINISPD
jgi:ribosomal protein L27